VITMSKRRSYAGRGRYSRSSYNNGYSRSYSKSNGSRTGGTGDVKPQILTAYTSAVVSGTAAVQTINMPTPRLANPRNKSVIMEILSVDFYLGPEDAADYAKYFCAYLSTNSGRDNGDTGITEAKTRADLIDPQTFAAVVHSPITTTSGAMVNQFPLSVNLTDNNGNGFLVAGDKIQLVFLPVNNGSACSAIVKIKYRLSGVGLAEYVGIVQSQQSQ